MVNLSDITREAGRGSGLEALSRHYGLDAAQTAKVIEVLLPAFTLAFQRLVLNPVAFADFTKALTSGAYGAFFDNPNQSHAASSGAALIEQLFRSPEAARQVAAQAAAMSGVGGQVMQQLMPNLAATVVGGMSRYATVGGFADLLRQWGDALKTAGERLDPPKPKDPWSAWQAAAAQMMGLRAAAPDPRPPPVEPSSVLDAWVAMVGAMTGMASPAIAPPGGPAAGSAPPASMPSTGSDATSEAVVASTTGDGSKSAPEPEEPNPFEAVSQMFETGRDLHAQQVAAFQSILDDVWGTSKTAS